jgi:hypothetical protein
LSAAQYRTVKYSELHYNRGVDMTMDRGMDRGVSMGRSGSRGRVRGRVP